MFLFSLVLVTAGGSKEIRLALINTCVHWRTMLTGFSAFGKAFLELGSRIPFQVFVFVSAHSVTLKTGGEILYKEDAETFPKAAAGATEVAVAF